MVRFGVLVAAAALAACRGGGGRGDTVSVTGVVSAVLPHAVRVRTDDGRQLALDLTDHVAVTLAGGEAQTAVITEGAPVRVSYRPKGAGGELVSVDVEPQARNGRGEAKDVPAADPPADPARARGSR